MMMIQHAQRNLSSLGKDSLFSLTEKGLIMITPQLFIEEIY